MKFLTSSKLSEHRYKTPEGYLVCVDAIIARTGKQEYRNSELFADSNDDSVIEVDRPYKEVFSPETVASFENKPLVNEHPEEDVNVENYREYSIGFVRDVHEGEEDGKPVLMANLIVTDPEAIEEIENGKTQLSCGYDCDILGDSEKYQANIRGNHVALCEQGRAGNARIVDTAKKIKDWSMKYLGHTIEEVFFSYYDDGHYAVDGNTRKSECFDTLEEAKAYIRSIRKQDSIEDSESLEKTQSYLQGKKDYSIEADKFNVKIEKRANGYIAISGKEKDVNSFIKHHKEKGGLKDASDKYQEFKAKLMKVENKKDLHQWFQELKKSDLDVEEFDKLMKFYNETKADVKDANKKLELIISYFDAWGYPVGKELQEAVNFYRMSREDVNKVFGPRIGRTYNKEELQKLKTFDPINDSKNKFKVEYEIIGEDKQSEVVFANSESEAEREIEESYEPRERKYIKFIKITKISDSINDVEPRAGESKEEFISRFMSETKEEYPNQKQRLAVAHSYWNKDSLNEDSVKDSYKEDLIRIGKKDGFYFYSEEYIDKLSENEAKIALEKFSILERMRKNERRSHSSEARKRRIDALNEFRKAIGDPRRAVYEINLDSMEDLVKDNFTISYDYDKQLFTAKENDKQLKAKINEKQYKKIEKIHETYGTNLDTIKNYLSKQKIDYSDSVKDSPKVYYIYNKKYKAFLSPGARSWVIQEHAKEFNSSKEAEEYARQYVDENQLKNTIILYIEEKLQYDSVKDKHYGVVIKYYHRGFIIGCEKATEESKAYHYFVYKNEADFQNNKWLRIFDKYEQAVQYINKFNLGDSYQEKIINGYVIGKNAYGRYTVYNNKGHFEEDKNECYKTEEEAIKRANSLPKGIAIEWDSIKEELYTYEMIGVNKRYLNKHLSLEKAKKILKNNKDLGFDGNIINEETGEIIESTFKDSIKDNPVDYQILRKKILRITKKEELKKIKEEIENYYDRDLLNEIEYGKLIRSLQNLSGISNYLDSKVQDNSFAKRGKAKDSDKDIEIESKIELDYRSGKLNSKQEILEAVKKLEDYYHTTYSKDIISYLQRQGFIIDSLKDDEIDKLINEENEAVESYEQAINNTKNHKRKQTYNHILGEELEHIEELEYLQEDVDDSVNDEVKKIIKYKGFMIEELTGYQSPQYAVYNKNGYNMNSHLSTSSDLKQIKKEIDWGYLDDYINDSVKDMSLSRRDAMDRCIGLGEQFIAHFDKIYKNPKDINVNHWAKEMNSWYQSVKKIKLKENNKEILKGDLRDWFLTAGANPQDFMKNPEYEELQAYDEFSEKLLSGIDVLSALKNCSII